MTKKAKRSAAIPPPIAQGKQPSPVDIAIGARIRAARIAAKMSQEALGDKLGVTFQQVQKYEKGMNRVGGSRMHAIAEAFNLPVSHLFGDDSELSAADDALALALFGDRMHRRMVTAYMKLKRPQQEAAMRLFESLVGESN